MGKSKDKTGSDELFKWDGNPTPGQIAPLAIQHVLAAVVGCVTPAILVANAANNAGGSVDPDVTNLRSIVNTVTVVWKQDPYWIRSPGYYRSQLCLCANNDSNCFSGKGSRYDSGSDGDWRYCSNFSRIIY